MRTIHSLIMEIEGVRNWDLKEVIIKRYMEEVIEACASSAEYTMCEDDLEAGHEVYTTANGKQVYPVLMRSTIYSVIEKIK